ncbi:MAG: ABC transporter, partial [Clostridia bacterium]|nr:ABC transporter [Clostridia bacterium]
LFRNHALNGVLESIKNDRAPMPIPVDGFKDMLDCNIYFFDNQVSIGAMYIVLICSVALLVGAYVLINALKKEK